MWSIEKKDPMLRSTITSVVLLDQAPDREDASCGRSIEPRVVPRLRQRVQEPPLGGAATLEISPHFDLDYHLRFLELSGDATEADVLAVAQPLAMQGFDQATALGVPHHQRPDRRAARPSSRRCTTRSPTASAA